MKQILFVSFCALFLFLGVDCKNDPPVKPCTDCPQPEPDSTSHEIAWSIDTIGTFQSRLADVWGSDTNNVYAVGFVYISFSPYKATNIMHWNGSKWDALDYLEGDLNSIYGFGPNDIWVAGYWQVDANLYALIAHWNGSQWQTWKLQQYNLLTSIWGTSSNNMFACGGNGTILHFDGISWSKIESGTTFRLSDVWGNSKTNELYFVGGNLSNGEGVLVYFNEKMERIVTHTIPQYSDSGLYGRLLGIRGVNDTTVYIIGPHAFVGNLSTWSEINLQNDNTIMEKVRGVHNNLYVTGSFSLILHYNGNSWYRYNQLYRKPDGDLLANIWESKKRVFIVGQTGSAQGVIYRGKQD